MRRYYQDWISNVNVCQWIIASKHLYVRGCTKIFILPQCNLCACIKYQNSFLPSTIKMNGISICVFGRESHPFNGIFTLKEKQLVMMFAWMLHICIWQHHSLLYVLPPITFMRELRYFLCAASPDKTNSSNENICI